MKKLETSIVLIITLLSILLSLFNIRIANSFFQYLFYVLISGVIISASLYKTSSKFNKTISLISLIDSLLLCLFESKFFIIPYICITILILIKYKSIILRSVLITIGSCLLVLSAFSWLFQPNIVSKDINNYSNSDNNFCVKVKYIDTGATGSSYVYYVEKPIYKNDIIIYKRIAISDNLISVSWENNESVIIGDKKYHISLLSFL